MDSQCIKKRQHETDDNSDHYLEYSMIQMMILEINEDIARSTVTADMTINTEKDH